MSHRWVDTGTKEEGVRKGREMVKTQRRRAENFSMTEETP